MNMDWVAWPPHHRTTDVYLPEEIADTFRRFMSLMNQFEFFEKRGIVRNHVIGNAETVTLGEYAVTPVRLAADYAFGYIVSGGGKNVLIVMDELKDWDPGAALGDISFDLACLPLGIFDVNPLDGKRLIAPLHPMLTSEQTVAETIDTARRLKAKKIVLTHIEEPNGISLELAKKLEAHYTAALGRELVLAYDTMIVDI